MSENCPRFQLERTMSDKKAWCIPVCHCVGELVVRRMSDSRGTHLLSFAVVGGGVRDIGKHSFLNLLRHSPIETSEIVAGSFEQKFVRTLFALWFM